MARLGALQATYGFLYLDYGESAWWWEVEELVRKLLLSSLVVLIDAGSPLQVSLQYVWPRAVLCGQDATIPPSVKPDVAHGTDTPVCILERASLACMRSITHIGNLSLPPTKTQSKPSITTSRSPPVCPEYRRSTDSFVVGNTCTCAHRLLAVD